MGDVGGRERDPQEISQALAELTELLTFRDRFSRDPQAALGSRGLSAIPPELVDTLASLSPEELRVFAEVQRKLAEVPVGDEVGIFF